MSRASNGFLALGAAALLAVTLVAYVPALHARFIWDDDAYVLLNDNLKTPGGLRAIWTQPFVRSEVAPIQFYPVVHTVFWLEYRAWGLNPFGYHLVNVLLHSLNAIALWLLLRRLQVSGAFFAAALFALHPLHVESVAWITELKNVLSGLFYLLSLHAAVGLFGLGGVSTAGRDRWARRDQAKYPAGPAVRPYQANVRSSVSCFTLMILFFALALLSKTVTATLPAAILLLIWWKRGAIAGREIRAVLPMFALGAAAGLGTAWLEQHHVGAQGSAWSLSFAERCLVAGRALWFYASKLFWPTHLTFMYPRWTINASSWPQYLFLLDAALVVGVLWFVRKAIGRGPLVAVLFFAGTLFPALGFFNVFPMLYSFVADHFAYLASLGLIVLAAAAGAAIFQSCGPRVSVLRFPVAVAVLAVLGALTWRQCLVYLNQETLWRDTLAKNPSCWMAHVNLGKLLSMRGDSAEAAMHYQVALELNPDDAGARNNLAIELGNLGRPDEAIRQYRESIRLWPRYVDARLNLAIFLTGQGKWGEAAREYDAALQLAPDNAMAHNNLAWLLATQDVPGVGGAANALRHAERAVDLTGRRDPGALDTLGAAYAAAGRFNDAVKTAGEAVDLATRTGQTGLVQTVKGHLQLYRAGKPCR